MSSHVSVRGVIAPIMTGVPSSPSGVHELRQNNTTERLSAHTSRARADGVEPGMAFHGTRIPEASPSPTSLPLVVVRAKSPMLMDQENEGRSNGESIRPVIVSARYARHITRPIRGRSPRAGDGTASPDTSGAICCRTPRR